MAHRPRLHVRRRVRLREEAVAGECGGQGAALQALRGENGHLQKAALADIEKNRRCSPSRAPGQGRLRRRLRALPQRLGHTRRQGLSQSQRDKRAVGGTLDELHQTIHRDPLGHAEGREGAMLGFGRDGVLKAPDYLTVANYVRSLSGLTVRPDLAAGKKILAAVCHNEDGKGNRRAGRPEPDRQDTGTGTDEATIIDVITNGRSSVVPAGSMRPPSRRWRSTSTRWAAGTRRTGHSRNRSEATVSGMTSANEHGHAREPDRRRCRAALRAARKGLSAERWDDSATSNGG